MLLLSIYTLMTSRHRAVPTALNRTCRPSNPICPKCTHLLTPHPPPPRLPPPRTPSPKLQSQTVFFHLSHHLPHTNRHQTQEKLPPKLPSISSGFPVPMTSIVVESLRHVQLYNPMDHRPAGPSVHGISQARILKWVAISFSR